METQYNCKVRKIAASHFKVPFAHYDARHAASPLAPVHTNFNIASWALQFGRGREVAWPGLAWPGLVVRGTRLRSSHHTAALSSLVTRAGNENPRRFHNHGVPSSTLTFKTLTVIVKSSRTFVSSSNWNAPRAQITRLCGELEERFIKCKDM